MSWFDSFTVMHPTASSSVDDEEARPGAPCATERHGAFGSTGEMSERERDLIQRQKQEVMQRLASLMEPPAPPAPPSNEPLEPPPVALAAEVEPEVKKDEAEAAPVDETEAAAPEVEAEAEEVAPEVEAEAEEAAPEVEAEAEEAAPEVKEEVEAEAKAAPEVKEEEAAAPKADDARIHLLEEELTEQGGAPPTLQATGDDEGGERRTPSARATISELLRKLDSIFGEDDDEGAALAGHTPSLQRQENEEDANVLEHLLREALSDPPPTQAAVPVSALVRGEPPTTTTLLDVMLPELEDDLPMTDDDHEENPGPPKEEAEVPAAVIALEATHPPIVDEGSNEEGLKEEIEELEAALLGNPSSLSTEAIQADDAFLAATADETVVVVVKEEDTTPDDVPWPPHHQTTEQAECTQEASEITEEEEDASLLSTTEEAELHPAEVPPGPEPDAVVIDESSNEQERMELQAALLAARGSVNNEEEKEDEAPSSPLRALNSAPPKSASKLLGEFLNRLGATVDSLPP